MANLPHDVTDLRLAPVVLALDARIEELAGLSQTALRIRVGLSSDLPDRTSEMRESGLLRTVAEGIDTHGWELGLVDRGIRILHEQHTLVLGVPENFRTYIAGPTPSASSDVLTRSGMGSPVSEGLSL